MPTITTNDLKNGMALDLDDGLFEVVEFQHVKPGKGGAFVRTTLKNVRTGAVVDRTFRGGEKVERAMIDKREMQFLYRDGDGLRLHGQRPPTTSSTWRPSSLGDGRRTTWSSRPTPSCKMFGDEIVGVELPAAVELNIAETEPGIQGDRVSGARKPATLETGLVVQVPLFVGPGDRVKVDTRTGEYLTRA